MAVPTDPNEPTRETIEAAAVWQAQMGDENRSDDDRVAFREWISAHPSHRLAYDRMTVLAGGAVHDPAQNGETRRRARRRIAIPVALLLGSLVASAWWAADRPDIRSRLAEDRTAIGQQERIAFGAGDRVTLDSESAADIDEALREVRLWRGAVMAEVKAGAAAHFTVRTPQGTARALGTRYSVRVDGDVTTVRVIESRVEACAALGDRACVTLGPGQSATLDGAGAHRGANVDPVGESAWAAGLLIADDRPLAAVIDELNRYRQSKVRYSPADIAGLRISGTFALTDTDRALKSISAALPVTVNKSEGGPIITRR